jgi:hypothetical protein
MLVVAEAALGMARVEREARVVVVLAVEQQRLLVKTAEQI